MTVLRLRCTSGLFIAALAALAISERALTQDRPHADGDKVVRNGYNELYGPSYSKTQMQSMKILGVHLGMRWNDAERVILSQGFARNSEYGFSKSDGPGRIDLVGFDVKRFDGLLKRVAAVSYWRNVDLETQAKRAAVRDESFSAFGTPTVWFSPERGKDLIESMHWLTSDSIFDKDQRYRSRVCGSSWRCDYVLYEEDCRPRVKDAHGVALEISMLHSVRTLHYELYDMDLELKKVRKSKRFWEMDVGDAICLIPRVH